MLENGAQRQDELTDVAADSLPAVADGRRFCQADQAVLRQDIGRSG